MAAVAAVALAYVAFEPGFAAGFYFDDLPNIVDTPALQWTSVSFDALRQTWSEAFLPRRFVANVTFGLNHAHAGLDPAGYHWVNWLIHLAVGALIVRLGVLLARAGGRRADSFTLLASVAAAGVFLLHPLAVQSVTYIVQRMTGLATLGGLGALALYVDARIRGGRQAGRYAAAAGCWVLAAATKEIAFGVPLVLIAYELIFHAAPWRAAASKVARRGRAPGVAIAVVLAFAAAAALAGWADRLSPAIGLFETFSGRDFNGIERMLTQARVQLFYVSLLLYPAPGRLNVDHDFALSHGLLEPWSTAPALVLVAAVAVGAVYLARRQPTLGFPLVAYLLLHAIESGPVNLELVFEHRMYQPMALLVLVIPAAASILAPRHGRVLVAAAICAWLPLAWMTHARNQTWADPVAFHLDCAAKSPNKYRPHYNLGTLLGPMGRLAEARAALERALALDPGSSQAHNQLGNIALLRGRLERAEHHYAEAVRLGGDNMEAVYNLAAALDRQRRFGAAIPLYERFVAHAPAHLAWKIPEVRQRLRLIRRFVPR